MESESDYLDVVTAYFVNCYWTRHYAIAQEACYQGRFSTLREAYKSVIEQFNRAFSVRASESAANRDYFEIVDSILDYIRQSTSVKISYRNLVDKISRLILPEMEYKNLSKYDPKKEKIAKEVLIQTVSKFTVCVLKYHVDVVLDRGVREDPGRTRRGAIELKETFERIFNSERDDFSNRIIAAKSGIDIDKTNIDSVPKELVDELQKEIKSQIKEKNRIISRYNKTVKYIKALKNVVDSTQSENETLKYQIETLRDKTKKLERMIDKPRDSAKKRVVVREVAEEKKPELEEEREVESIKDKYEKVLEKEFSGEDFLPVASVAGESQEEEEEEDSAAETPSSGAYYEDEDEGSSEFESRDMSADDI
jgi:hypothetical protein